MNYRDYIQSAAWRLKHPGWLKQSGYRCSMFPWVRCGKVSGKYRPYHCHHVSYDRLGYERYWHDVVVVCPLAHWLIHRVLGGADRVKDQRSPYPNGLQRVAHAWCRVPSPLKAVVLFAIGVRLLWMAWA